MSANYSKLVEMAWAQIKERFRRNNQKFTLAEVER